MPRFAANLSLLFTELAFLDRFDAARKAGFDGVEILFPYEVPASGIRAALDECGLPLVLINTPPGDWAVNERGFAAVPGAQAKFRDMFALAIEYASVLAPQHIHVMSGNASGDAAKATLIANLEWATAVSGSQSLLIEPLNPTDMSGYFLTDFTTASQVIRATSAPNLALQFDAYHAQRMGLDLLTAWAGAKPLVRHVQVASETARAEPDRATFAPFFQRLDRDGYAGWVSGEYFPAGETGHGLDWLSFS